MSSLKTLDGTITIISGSSRCGKTAKAAEIVRGYPGTVFVWDVEAQFCEMPGFQKIVKFSELMEVIKTGKRGKFAIVPGIGKSLKEQFKVLCYSARHYSQFIAPCLLVAEELADVESQGKASQEWGMCIRRGLKRGLSIVAISQRWAEADKTAMGNATRFLIFRAASAKDAQYICERSGADLATVTGLKPLEYVEFDTFTRQGLKKMLKFKK